MNENFDITYKALFRRYYPSLIFYATRLVGEEEAEDVVQDVFVELWKRKDHIEIEVFKLSYLHDMKNKEIADILGVSLRTVEAHMYKALKYLRGRLDPLWTILFLFLWRL